MPAGHYLPLLAAKLLAKKAQPELTGDANLSLQLRGIIAGNPWTSTLHDNTGAVNLMRSPRGSKEQTAQCAQGQEGRRGIE